MPQIITGSGGVNRKAKQLTVGVGGANRKVKEAWAGVSGANRKVFSSAVECTVTQHSESCASAKIYSSRLGVKLSHSSSTASCSFFFNFSETLTFANAGEFTDGYSRAGLDALMSQTGSLYYAYFRARLGGYTIDYGGYNKTNNWYICIPAASIPVVATQAEFYFSNSPLSSNNSEPDVSITRVRFFPKEYPRGLELPFGALQEGVPIELAKL